MIGYYSGRPIRNLDERLAEEAKCRVEIDRHSALADAANTQGRWFLFQFHADQAREARRQLHALQTCVFHNPNEGMLL